MLRHPDIFYAGCDILAELVSADLSPVCLDCVEMSVFNVKDSGCLLMEENFVEEMLVVLTLDNMVDESVEWDLLFIIMSDIIHHCITRKTLKCLRAFFSA